ncbi:conjugal transfer protein TraG N-terminal domain-containing protein [Ectothiorhodospira sp. BSL-9]|uniref:conjugal transfer protein TraG N-terminal domain-containing protein n=1 Tax=Ectothiorhodospira sp. BSL-9 TaxID=1442136 RepID=UPI0007B4FBBF|nr:conjugal transfer protein TraG N-terminal domain-containing protein [Ectothiorhodospira sp. BSL-9]
MANDPQSQETHDHPTRPESGADFSEHPRLLPPLDDLETSGSEPPQLSPPPKGVIIGGGAIVVLLVVSAVMLFGGGGESDPVAYEVDGAGALAGDVEAGGETSVTDPHAESFEADDLPPLSVGLSTGIVGSGNELFTQGVSAIGLVSFYTLFMEPTLALILQALPFIQALTLMGIYAMLPLVLLFGMYQPSILLVGAIAIFTVKFWAVLWHITLWVDNNLLQSLYTGTSLLDRVGPDLKSILLTTIIAGLYLGLPVIWSAMMGWVGFKAVGAINNATSELNNPSKQAGQQGGSLANRVATRGKGR